METLSSMLAAPEIEFLWRLFVALLLGAILGVEREMRGQTAGIRTHALVSLGAALFVAISELATLQYADVSGFDPMRMASQIVVGIGFIGAGVIIVRDDAVRGITTAAGVWVAGAIGTAAGFGFYLLGGFAVVLAILILSVLRPAEEYLRKKSVR